MPLMDSADGALQSRVAADKREAVAKAIQADARKYVDETVPIVRDRAIKLAPTVAGPILEEKFTEDELKQVVAMLESPVLAKFQSVGGPGRATTRRPAPADDDGKTRGNHDPQAHRLRHHVRTGQESLGPLP